MRAMVLDKHSPVARPFLRLCSGQAWPCLHSTGRLTAGLEAPATKKPLKLADLPISAPQDNQILVKVSVCGVVNGQTCCDGRPAATSAKRGEQHGEKAGKSLILSLH
jgi:hypothetical protein